MRLTEVIGDDWGGWANVPRLELSKLSGADPELLADVCGEKEYVISFHEHLVGAIVSEVIVPELAKESASHSHEIGQEIIVRLKKLWFTPADDKIYGSCHIKVDARVWPAVSQKRIERFFKVDKNAKIKLIPARELKPAHDIDLMPVFRKLLSGQSMDYYYPSEKLDKPK
jgi:hypothetical protein